MSNCEACGEDITGTPYLGSGKHKCITQQVCCPDLMGDEDDPWEYRGPMGVYWASDAAATYCDELLDVDDRSMLSGDVVTVRVRTRAWSAVVRGETRWGPWVEYVVSGEVVPSYHATRKES